MAPEPPPQRKPSDSGKIVETPVVTHKRPASASRDACLVHIYPTGPLMGTRYMIGDKPLIIGRAETCQVQISDFSVSRRHASIERQEIGYRLKDLGSTNGTYLNDQPTTEALLHDGDYIRVGNAIYRFLAGGNIEAEYHEEIYRLTIIDALTQTHNRRSLTEFLERELVRSSTHGRPLSMILLDVDRFKGINDELGHLAGDATLKELVQCIRPFVGPSDLFARYGGEEFAIVMVETAPGVARDVAERIRRAIEQHVFRFEGKSYPVTISLGVAGTNGFENLTVSQLLQRVDEKLYAAKESGRNRVMG